jgi:hypothetical protein
VSAGRAAPVVPGARQLHPEFVASHAIDRDGGDLMLRHLEAELTKQPERPTVVSPHDEPDTREPERSEPECEEKSESLGAQATTPQIGYTDDEADLRRVCLDIAKAAAPDGPLCVRLERDGNLRSVRRCGPAPSFSRGGLVQ